MEETAYDSYRGILNSKLCLCPKGNGNSSMRIVEALACGSVPVLINDFSRPFGIKWGGNTNPDDDCALIFDTQTHIWEYIYYECMALINDEVRYNKMVKRGKEIFENMIYKDLQFIRI